MEVKERVQGIITRMAQEDNIRLLAIDFDATIIEVHTYGAWRRTAFELSGHVRPVFVELLRHAVALMGESPGDLFVSVVTFSAQAKLIQQVLGIVLGSEVLARKVIIRCNDLKWPWPEGFERVGKEGHIGSVLEHIQSTTGTSIPVSQVILIDDDCRNIDIAASSGMRTAAFPALDPSSNDVALNNAIVKFLDRLEQSS